MMNYNVVLATKIAYLVVVDELETKIWLNRIGITTS
jgi:hypothetical protein